MILDRINIRLLDKLVGLITELSQIFYHKESFNKCFETFIVWFYKITMFVLKIVQVSKLSEENSDENLMGL